MSTKQVASRSQIIAGLDSWRILF